MPFEESGTGTSIGLKQRERRTGRLSMPFEESGTGSSIGLKQRERRTGRLSMHFEESGTGSSIGLKQRERYIATNRFNVRPGKEATFEERWAKRKSRLAMLEGFRFFSLLKKRETVQGVDDAPSYISYTIWQNKDNFDSWRTGEAFKEAHGGGGIMDFVQLLSTALFILKGKPNPAFYDCIAPQVSRTITDDFLFLQSPSGWRAVNADGVSLLPTDLVVVQDRFSVDDDGMMGFERDSCESAAVPRDEAEGFFGRFVQRRDATKADDSVNYLVTTMFKDIQSYNKFKSADPSAILSKAKLLSSVIYDAKLALSSELGP